MWHFHWMLQNSQPSGNSFSPIVDGHPHISYFITPPFNLLVNRFARGQCRLQIVLSAMNGPNRQKIWVLAVVPLTNLMREANKLRPPFQLDRLLLVVFLFSIIAFFKIYLLNFYMVILINDAQIMHGYGRDGGTQILDIESVVLVTMRQDSLPIF